MAVFPAGASGYRGHRRELVGQRRVFADALSSSECVRSGNRTDGPPTNTRSKIPLDEPRRPERRPWKASSMERGAYEQCAYDLRQPAQRFLQSCADECAAGAGTRRRPGGAAAGASGYPSRSPETRGHITGCAHLFGGGSEWAGPCSEPSCVRRLRHPQLAMADSSGGDC